MSGEIGFDSTALVGWLDDNLERSAGPYSLDLIEGGKSNLTYRVTDSDGYGFVLRRPPLGQVLATAHDVLREYRIYDALQGTSVPVPTTLGVCDDATIIGAPFFLMEFVSGSVLGDPQDAAAYPYSARWSLGADLADVMGALHDVDPVAVGLGDLSQTDGYISRQLRRWRRQYSTSETADIPLLDRIADRLSERIPPQRRSCIVHGDLRLGNVIATDEGTVAAVLDWELTTLGDPLADLGWLLMAWAAPGERLIMPSQSASVVGGFPSRAEMIDRYATITGSDVSDLPFYEAFAFWRSACIAVGVIDRSQEGHVAGEANVDAFVEAMRLSGRQALELIEGR